MKKVKRIHKLSELLRDLCDGNDVLYHKLIFKPYIGSEEKMLHDTNMTFKRYGYDSPDFDKLLDNKKSEADVKSSYDSNIDNPIYKEDKIKHNESPTPYYSKIVGRGQDISNALRYGFRTCTDVASILHVSKRTAYRIMHPDTEHYSNSGSQVNIKHTIKFYNIKDDIHHHWEIRKSKHPDKYHKYDWRLSKNMILGRYRPITAVDRITLMRYKRKLNSPVEIVTRKRYQSLSKGHLLLKFKKYRRKELFQKIRFNLLLKLIKEYQGKSPMQLTNYHCDSHITNYFYNPYSYIDDKTYIHNFRDFLCYCNEFYITKIYRAESSLHNFRDWKMPVEHDKLDLEDMKVDSDNPKEWWMSEEKSAHAGDDEPDGIHYLPILRVGYSFDSIVHYTVSSALLYWSLYARGHYCLISLFKQKVLHQAYKELELPDPNPLYSKKKQKQDYNYVMKTAKKLLDTYNNKWHH